MQESFWWWQRSDRYIISLSPHLDTPFPPFSPSLISLMVSVDVKHHAYFLDQGSISMESGGKWCHKRWFQKEGWTRVYLSRNRKEMVLGGFKKRGEIGFISTETGRKWCQKTWFQKRGGLGFIFIETGRKWCQKKWFQKRGGLRFISTETGRKWCQVVSKEGWTVFSLQKNRKEMVSQNVVSKEGWTRIFSLHRNRKEMVWQKVVFKERWTRVFSLHRNRKEMVSQRWFPKRGGLSSVTPP